MVVVFVTIWSSADGRRVHNQLLLQSDAHKEHSSNTAESHADLDKTRHMSQVYIMNSPLNRCPGGYVRYRKSCVQLSK